MNFIDWYTELKEKTPNDDKIHRNIIPILHGALWFLGLFVAKYAPTIFNFEDRQLIVTLCGIVPTIIVFSLEIVITFMDIYVAHKADGSLKISFAKYVAFFCFIFTITTLLVVLYLIWSVDILYIGILLFSASLKMREYLLIHNIDKYLILMPASIVASGNYRQGYSIPQK